MDFNLSEEQSMLRDAAAKFVASHYAPAQQRHFAGIEPGFDPGNWRRFADLGWLGVALPESFSGMVCSFEEIAILMEQFGRALVLEPYVSTAVLCSRILDRAAVGELRQQCLTAVLNGALRLVLAADEWASLPENGRAATLHAIGAADMYRLSGVVPVVFDAPSADKLIVSARLADSGELALFLVDAGAKGVASKSYPLIDGPRAADVRFVDVEVAKSALLAVGDRARQVLEEALDRATVARLAEAVGVMEACLEVTSTYIKERRQFGQPIGKFQALQHIMADMFVETQESRSLLLYAIANIDTPDAVLRKSAVSLAKVGICASGNIVAANAIQLHGGYGVTDEYVVSWYYRRMMSIEKSYGDSDYHLNRYGKLSTDLL
jgi:alkylation response protein AidB-like acyl-CoA dehydrogenase